MMDQTAYKTAQRSYLGYLALALGLCAAVGLVMPEIASSLAVPMAFFTAQIAGARFASQAGRAMNRAETIRLTAVAVAVQVGLGALALAVVLLAETQTIVAIHVGTILLIGLATAVICAVLTLAGLRFGARMELRRIGRDKSGT